MFPLSSQHLEGGQLLPFIGEEIGPGRESKLIKVTQLHSFEKDILYYYIVSGAVQGNGNTWAKTDKVPTCMEVRFTAWP